MGKLIQSLTIATLIVLVSISSAEDLEEWADKIPDGWVKDIPALENSPTTEEFPGADAVFLYDIDFYTYKKNYSVQTGAIKILTRKGAEDFREVESPPFRKLEKISAWARIVKPNGSLVDVPPQNIINEKIWSGGGAARDIWIMKIDFSEVEPGSIIQYQFLQKDTEFSNFKYFQRDIPMLLCQKVLIIKMKEPEFEVKPFRSGISHVATPARFDPSYFVHSWTKENTRAFQSEPFAPPKDQTLPQLMWKRFDLADYLMLLSREKIFQDIYHDMAVRSDPTGNTKSIVDHVTSGLTDRREMVSKLYAYVQKNFRAPLGRGRFWYWSDDINGMLKKGDLRRVELNFIFYSLMKTLGAKTEAVLVSRQRPDDLSNLPPVVDLDNLIVLVEIGGDSVFADPGSLAPLGVITPVDQGKYGFIFEKERVNTLILPDMTKDQNQIVTLVRARINSDFSFSVAVEQTRRGISAARFLSDSTLWSPDTLKSRFLRKLSKFYPSLNIEEVSWKKAGGDTTDVVISYRFNSPDYVVTMPDGSLKLNPFLVDRDTMAAVLTSTTRENALVFEPVLRVDSIQIQLPEGFAPEKLPAQISARGYHGEFKTDLSFDGKVLLVVRESYIHKNYVRTQFYDSVRIFCNEIAKKEAIEILLRIN